MQEFGFSHWMAVRAKRLRFYRAIVNSFLFVAAVILLLSLSRRTLPPSAWGLALIWGFYLFSYFLLSCGFFYGIIKCPSCDVRFAPKFPPGWVPRRCQNCGFDVYTLQHATSNNRWRGP
jgi:hypothetical protein